MISGRLICRPTLRCLNALFTVERSESLYLGQIDAATWVCMQSPPCQTSWPLSSNSGRTQPSHEFRLVIGPSLFHSAHTVHTILPYTTHTHRHPHTHTHIKTVQTYTSYTQTNKNTHTYNLTHTKSQRQTHTHTQGITFSPPNSSGGRRKYDPVHCQGHCLSPLMMWYISHCL